MIVLVMLGLTQGAIIALNAVALSLVYGATRTVNLAHGDIFGLASALVASVILANIPEAPVRGLAAVGVLLLGLLGGMAGGTLLSLAVERIAFRPFRGQPLLAPLIATVSLSFVFFQVALFLRTPQDVPALMPQSVLLRYTQPGLDRAFRAQDAIILVIAVALVLATEFFLRYTRHGRAIRAWSQDPEVAQLCGVHNTRTTQLVFALGGALAGAAAWSLIQVTHQPARNYGLESGLVALAAAVLGGIGRPRGALISGLGMGILSALSDAMRIEEWTPVVVLVVLVLVLVLRPHGIASEAGGSDDLVLDEPGLDLTWAPWAGWMRSIVLGVFVLAASYPLFDWLFAWHEHVQLISMLFFVILALGLTISLGYAGVLDLGYAASFTLGAYTTAVLTTINLRIAAVLPRIENFVLAFACSLGVTMLYGAFLAGVTRRMHGGYVAIVTLACAQVLQRLAYSLRTWTGGAEGIAVIPPPILSGYRIESRVAWYYIVLLVATVVFVVCLRLRDSRQGRAWRALSNDALAAMSCGIAVQSSRRRAIVLGTMVAGAAGSLYASMISYVHPSRADFLTTVLVLAMVVVGGAGNLFGAVLGALAIAGLDQVAIPRLGAWVVARADDLHWPWLYAFDPRGYNLLAFGLALYLALWMRAGAGARRSGARRRDDSPKRTTIYSSGQKD